MSLKSYTGSPAAPNVTYCYDRQIAASQDGVCTAPTSSIPNSRGRLTQMRSSASTTTHSSYDGLGRVTQSSQITGTAPPYTFGDSTHPGYTYNAAGLLTSLRYPSGRTVATGYDSAGRPNTLGLDTNATQYVSAVTYWPHGAINQLAFGTGGVQETTAYDPQRLQPTSIAGSSSSSGALLTLGYGWCPASDCTKNNGNLASQTITVGSLVMTQSYGYDKLNRLASAVETAPSQPGWNQSYTYDAYGNRAVGGNWIPNGAKTPQSLNDYLDNTGASPPPNTNRWKAWTPTFTNGNVYDAAGNLQKVTNGLACSPAPCPQYGYDAESRMVSATSLQSTPDTTYVYDGDGRRVQKVQSTAATTYVYDATGNLAAEYGTPTDHGTKFLLTDHLGSTRVLVASDGTSPKRYDYLPFGEEIQAGTNGRGPEFSAGVYPSPAGPQSLEFTGKERDAETGLDYFGARYMSAAQGRFTNPDPSTNGVALLDPQSWNLYSYVRSRPTRFVDRNGNWATEVHAQILTFALQGYVSAGELQHLINRQYIMDQDQSPSVQYMHAMRNGKTRQSSADASAKMWDWVAWNMEDAKATRNSDGSFSDVSLVRLGDAIHTVEDYTSPMHTTPEGDLRPWFGMGLGAAGHWAGESSPNRDWSGIGWAVRLTMAAFMQANPEQAGAHGLTSETFNRESAKRISEYVDWFYRSTNARSSPGQQDAARQCALGNPAACDAVPSRNPR